jgi:hypothetical protein
MKRSWIWIIVAAVAVLVGAAVLFALARNDTVQNGGEVRTGEQADTGDTRAACELFTQEVAVQVLGEDAQAVELPPESEAASNEDVSVTNCVYEAGEDQELQMASVLVRGAKSEGAYEGNEFGFEDTRTFGGFEEENSEVESESIANLGDDAYYNPAFGQVHVLANDGQYWFIVNVEDNREASEALAQAVVDNL